MRAIGIVFCLAAVLTVAGCASQPSSGPSMNSIRTGARPM